MATTNVMENRSKSGHQFRGAPANGADEEFRIRMGGLVALGAEEIKADLVGTRTRGSR